MEKYNIRVLTHNSIIIHRNKKVRTPAEFLNLTEADFNLLVSQIRANSLNYEVFDEKKITLKSKKPFVIKDNKEVRVEELYDPKKEPNTIMEKLIADNKMEK